MGSNPWDANAGKFDVPSSSVISRAAARAALDALPDMPGAAEKRRAAYLDSRVRDLRHSGVVSTGGSILLRIDQAMQRLIDKGCGNPTSIALTDVDLVAFKAAHGGWDYRDVKVLTGADSKVYGRRGARETIRKRVTQ